MWSLSDTVMGAMTVINMVHRPGGWAPPVLRKAQRRAVEAGEGRIASSPPTTFICPAFYLPGDIWAVTVPPHTAITNRALEASGSGPAAWAEAHSRRASPDDEPALRRHRSGAARHEVYPGESELPPPPARATGGWASRLLSWSSRAPGRGDQEELPGGPHRRDGEDEPPRDPVVFLKPSTSSSDGRSTKILPAWARLTEAELAVVMNPRQDVPVNAPTTSSWGTHSPDVSARDRQRAEPQ